ncbi:hypothetical protein M378DRAFT_184072 [Amanita muscaria Koide BX008]|uniref:Kynureninase n=1 Tax=Amanita muscaria (strain Koide BX008) TaxID=946122 RepID=A0A0C2XKQ8_AMAMK|nr:hypothetical protein M378DRAFT_184072 [Amanita muscaria Koide BX008]
MHSPLSLDFIVPTNADVSATVASDPQARCCYLSGNSLGLLSNRSRELIKEELDVWASRGVTGHFDHPHNRPWVRYVDVVTPLLAEIVGAKESEVACMGTLTANLHVMMDSFYKPTPERFKILCEARAFPSDQYAFASQALSHGYDPAQAILAISPREGEATLREEDILDIIEKEGKSIALVLFSGVQYYTGQLFPIESITKAAVSQGCICGWDLAHAIGNVPLFLHDWGVDFAVWCSYKFLNSGPGGIAGLFMHEKWNSTKHPNRTGWWGHDPTTRFKMLPTFSAIPGAQGFQQSNPCIIALASLLGSLQIFKQVGMKAIRERSLALTGALERSLRQSNYYVPLNKALSESQITPGFTIITPTDPMHRGAQLSLLFLPVELETMQKVFTYLTERGVVVDERKPDVIRLAPTPLYNTIDDCDTVVYHLNAALDSLVR